MTAAFAFLFVFATAAGLGIWFPYRSIAGRLFLGAAAIPVLMSLLHFTTATPLSVTGAFVTFLALPGLMRIGSFLIRSLRGLTGTAPSAMAAKVLANPAVVLPMVVAAAAIARGLDTYSLYSWDEFASWVYWPREAFAANTFFADAMNWQSLLYTQGLSMAMIYPQTFFGHFEPIRGLAALTLWHAGMLGLVYEALRAHLRRAAPAMTPPATALAAWLTVLLLLAVEATWTLLPELLLVEKPQIYLIAGAFAFLLLGAAETAPVQRKWCLIGAGCALAAGYLVKVTVLGAVPAAMLAVAIMPLADGKEKSGHDWRVAGGRLLNVLVPVAAVYLWWAFYRPFDAGLSCLADPFTLSLSQGEAGSRLLDTAARLAATAADYLQAYKLPLTALAAFGVAAGLRYRRTAPVAAGIAVYAVVYMGSLLPLYAWCYGGSVELAQLESLQRYLRVPLRLLHLFGPVLLVLVLARLANRRPVDGLLRFLAGRAGLAAMAALVAAAAALQVRAIDVSVRNVVDRDREPAHTVAAIRQVNQDAERLLRVMDASGMYGVDVILVAQGKQGFEQRIGRYHALHEQRGRRFRYRLHDAFSWGPAARNIWMQATTADELAALFRTQGIVWPLITDPWVRGVLKGLVADPACGAAPENYFLVRNRTNDPAFRCVRKEAQAGSQEARPPAKTK